MNEATPESNRHTIRYDECSQLFRVSGKSIRAQGTICTVKDVISCFACRSNLPCNRSTTRGCNVPVGPETMAPMAYAVVSGHRKPIVTTNRCENANALIDARQGEANRAYRVFF